MQIGHFIKAFVNNPLGVSTIFPASKALSSAMAKSSEVGVQQNIVEIGVGTGAITAQILPLMGKSQKYTGFEIDKTFYKYLNNKFIKEYESEINNLNKFEFKLDSAENLSSFFEPNSVDVVVSSLPWSVLNLELQKNILTEVHKILKPGGLFSFYNYMISSQFKPMRDFKNEINKQFKSLEPRARVFKSIPPATVWVATK